MVANIALKVWLIVSTFSLLQTGVQSAPLLSLQDENGDQNHNKYVVFNLLEQALLENKFNIYQLQTTFYSESLVLCLPVEYEIECDPDLNDTWNINCTSGYHMTFLWTYFDTENFAGRFLMYFTKNRLKSPLFTIRHKYCEYSLDGCGIKLYLNVSSFPDLRGNYSVKNLISSTLMDITKKLKDYAYTLGDGISKEQPAVGGYALPWSKAKANQFRNDTRDSEKYTPGVLVPIAFLVGISCGYEVLKWVGERNNCDSESHHYYLFWSFQFLAALINGVHTWYIHQILPIAIVIPATAFVVYSTFIVYWYYRAEEDFPFTKSPCLCFSNIKSKCSIKFGWIIIVNVFAVGNPFVFFVYMAYTLPWIVLGFYLYPIKILVRISAILTASLLIIVISFVILWYFEKCMGNLKSIYSNCNFRKCCCCEECGYESIEEQVPTGELFCNWISAATKCVTGVFVLSCSGFLGYLLHHIIFVFTNDVEEAVVELLHVLPLIVISLSAYIIRKLMQFLDDAKNNTDSQNVRQPDARTANRGPEGNRRTKLKITQGNLTRKKN